MTNWSSYLAGVGLVWYTALTGISILGCITARRKYRLRPRSPLSSSPDAPGVSILRPLKGLDTNLYENLETTFKQDYPKYELIMAVADAHDQALPVVHELMRKYPKVDARVIIGETCVGVNPKVNNLIRPYREAKYDILWVIDSNISISPQAMACSVDALVDKKHKRRIALVHHVPFATYDEWALGSAVECAFLNTNHAKMYIAINQVAVDSCIVGKSCMYRRSDLERVNGSLHPTKSALTTDDEPRGLPAFARFLAEDNMIGGALWHELDCRHAIGPDVAVNTLGRMRLADYIWRRVRWIRVRKRMTVAATLVEPFQESLMMGVILASSLQYFTGLNPLWSVLAHFGWWIAVDLDVYASLAGYPLPSGKTMEFAGAWLLRECLALPIWMLAMVGNTVEWRGQQYTILRNGEVSIVGKEGYQRVLDA